MSNNIPVIRVPEYALLPNKGEWCNRFEIRSSTSNKVYVIAQNQTKRHWGCSCRGWINHRKCKHLEALGLPCFEKPKEVAVKSIKG